MVNRIQHLLHATIGLDAASVGVSVIERAVRLRMKSRGLKQTEDYLKILKTSAAELNDLIEAVVVPETWFFRDKEPFAAMATRAVNDWLPAHPTGRLRVLSVACASGEEPYSIVMTLLDAGMMPAQFEVCAVDISERALARARRAVYRKNSFRGRDLGFRSRYFKLTKDGYQLAESVRDCVHFQQGNLLDNACLARGGQYDFIFCRNLLIYFDRETQARAVKKLEQLLAPGGLCFVGAAELPLALNHGLVSANLPMAFACRKVDSHSQVGRAVLCPPHQIGAQRSARPTRPTIPTPPPQPRSPAHTDVLGLDEGRASSSLPATPNRRAVPTSRDAPYLLDDARRLADAGKLEEAGEICHSHLQAKGTSAAAYYLLGLVHDARNDAPRAGVFYRKTLYLEPNHCEALLNLALLKEKEGDAAAARKLRQRARRITTSEARIPLRAVIGSRTSGGQRTARPAGIEMRP